MNQKYAPPIIGLAGGIGSGKSTITKYFNNLGIQSVDADDVAREVVQPGSSCLTKIVERFGANILLTDGTLDRKALRDIVFKHPDERRWLESITHPEIRASIATQLANAHSPYVLLVHPLLFETEQNKLCKFVVVIDTPKEIQIERIIRRDQSTEEQALRIINTQLNNEERLKQADFILKNNSNLIDLDDKVVTLNQCILARLDVRELNQ
ncbi:dephospho-CoA kinase [Marinomonas pollencensis]|uniref:Dephospho-CoA kinase n=1 Tax=Marinomonas pollencensis TaxID=491954 RepID=A0A3E0DQT4_9GAMM|nr:dephospho-CoA kinase [Marinomonas pollencensis]REG85485.1 dephospho-CoA kinase [Marinomonas pollencensis]